ncbi:Sodium/calcium exchanger protein-domain-containing protein [Coemansia mojavensis]|nr:Sodium/calcium exchanger protein-domain-containing protein [Coemansia mojavensis]
MPLWDILLLLLATASVHALPSLQPAPGPAAAAESAFAAPHARNIGSKPVRLSSFDFLPESSGKRCHRAVRSQPNNCSFIRDQCAGYGDGLVDYVEQYYCIHPTWHRCTLLLLTLWLALLFIWLGVSASEYFSPNISTLAKLLRLPESLAGVTLLAIGNGAPDLSSTYSAVRAGSAALAIGQIVGSAAFIVSVVVCATTLAVPKYAVSRLSYMRELWFFVATVSMIAVIVLSEKLSQTMAVAMVALYAAYVLTVVITTYYEERCQALELETEFQPARSNLHDERNESLLRQQITGNIYPEGGPGQDHGLVWDGTAVPVASAVAATTRRRNTIGSTEYRNSWDPDRFRAESISAKAVGEFLQQHRKSLLAAAECNDILDELVGVQAHQSPGFQAIDRHNHLTPQEPASQTASSERASRSCSRVPMPSNPPPIWKNYTMQPEYDQRSDVGSHTSQVSTASGANELNGRLASVQRPLLRCTNKSTPKMTMSLPSSLASKKANAALPLLHDQALNPPAIYLQGRVEPRSSLAGPKTLSPLSMHSQPSSGYIVEDPMLQHHTPCIASTDSVGIHSPSIPPRSPLSPANLASNHLCSQWVAYSSLCKGLHSSSSKLHAVLYTCVPTLRFWLPGASVPLKAFILFSALPVLLLTLTVPVVTFAPHDYNCQTRVDIDGDGSCCRDGSQNTNNNDSLTPALACSSAIDVQSVQTSPRLPFPDLIDCKKAAADIEWAEAAVSYMCSATSILFLLGVNSSVLSIASNSIWIAASAVMASLLANYTSRLGLLKSYWTQIIPCLIGFVNGLMWVSMIADEIVSITQALGLMLGLSEEILGLTVVGFGNSLGDLVTNLTLAQMGYPTMALSACFGGPMLCLLLGIGVAACGSMTRDGISDGSFDIPFTSPTILVSTACLLFNSLMFLLSIPRVQYRMTRGIGLCALFVYLFGMAVNVYIEW